MSAIGDAMQRAGAPRDTQDVYAAIKRVKGRGASRFVADKAGISVRQAQRRLAGQADPSRGRGIPPEDIAEPEWFTADALLSAQAFDCGHVDVTYESKNQGTRGLGTLTVDGELRGELQEVASLLMAGDHEGAEQAMSDALLGAYAKQRARDSRDIVKGTLAISNFRTGFNII